ncbi:TIGR04283 family arsenosugar biosynthesis glycosyltransferase [Zhaonella formicivorans]|uniref:TIGR04283 family arsenosugar biosynthesis glycosyltransferase n=1 Tax=Zhaonella formicivorans TaxID=2528593 RepID=UPI0010F3C864|nr:TIGR04283 family arsenosugar biosynthesis glycosyltransferase [Zhaonella formicivorans]
MAFKARKLFAYVCNEFQCAAGATTATLHLLADSLKGWQAVNISVIIPTYNEEKNIGRTLKQLAGMPGLEIVVSDGGSSDNTSKICASYPVKFICTSKGRGKQLNVGAETATGDIFFFLHADSIVEKTAFAEMRAAVQSGHKWGCCTLSFDEDTPFFQITAAASRLRAKVFSICFGDQGIFCERQFFISNGGFPDIPLMEDLSLSQKLRRYSAAKVLSAKIITSSRRFKEQGPLRTLLLMQKLKLLFYLGVSPDSLAKMYSSKRNQISCFRQ